MNTKITNYVDVLFSDIPRSKKAIELKEEMLANLGEYYAEAIARGDGENQAYTQALSALGDVDELLASLRPDDDMKAQLNHYKNKKAILTSVSIALYILSGAVQMIVSQYVDAGDNIANIIFLCVIALATALLIFSSMSMPYDVSVYLKSIRGDADDAPRYHDSNSGRILSRIMSIYWCLVTFVYFGISFMTGAWHITWLIWIIAPVLNHIIKLIFELCGVYEK